MRLADYTCIHCRRPIKDLGARLVCHIDTTLSTKKMRDIMGKKNVIYRYGPFGNFLCSYECVLARLGVCSICGSVGSRNEQGLCPSCYAAFGRSEPMLDHYGLLRYNYRPESYRFYGHGSPDSLYFGVEFEFEVPSDVPKELVVNFVRDKTDFFYSKHDGSLEHGFEIVSYPFSWAYLKEHPDVFSLIELLRHEMRCHTPTSCGFHVHMTKGAFTRTHLYKFMEIIYKNRKFIMNYTGRATGQMERYSRLRHSDPCLWAMAKSTPEKYHAVNLRNEDTVEVRIFRGTLLVSEFMEYMEFCKSLYEYTKEAKLQEVTLKDFVEYTHKHHKEYPSFDNKLSRMKMNIYYEEEQGQCVS